MTVAAGDASSVFAYGFFVGGGNPAGGSEGHTRPPLLRFADTSSFELRDSVLADNPGKAIYGVGNSEALARWRQQMAQFGFWEANLSPWDVCAGMLLVEEAEGKISNFSNQPVDIYSNELLATNGLIFDEMIKIIKKAK